MSRFIVTEEVFSVRTWEIEADTAKAAVDVAHNGNEAKVIWTDEVVEGVGKTTVRPAQRAARKRRR